MRKKIFLLIVLLSATGCSLFQKTNHRPDQMLVEKQLINLEQKIDEIYHRVSVIQFMVDNHERLIKTNKKTVSNLKKQKSQTITIREKIVPAPKDFHKIYDKAFTLYKKGDFKKSYKLFILFEKENIRDELADNALYWAGECLYSEKEYIQAAAVFKSVGKKYPNGNKVPDALLKTGYCFYSTGDKKNAKLYFKKVLRFYPFSEASKKAEIMLKRI